MHEQPNETTIAIVIIILTIIPVIVIYNDNKLFVNLHRILE